MLTVQLLLILPLCAAAADIADWYSYCWYYCLVRQLLTLLNDTVSSYKHRFV